MMSASLTLTLTLGVLGATSFEHVPPTKGRPELVLIQTDAPTVSMLIAFGAGYADDGSATGVIAQAQTALTHANSAFPLQQWLETAFAGGASLTTSLDPRQANFVLSAPQEEFTALAKPLVAALLSPRLSARAFAALKDRAAPEGSLARDTQMLMHDIEPLVLEGGAPRFAGKPAWRNFEEVEEQRRAHFTPANATIVVVGGFEPTKLRALFRASGGTRREYRRMTTRLGTHARVRSRVKLHLIGYPLPQLSAVEAAAVRVIERRLSAGLTRGLRENGVAYSVDVTPNLTPWFDGLLLVVPTFDESGLSLEQYLTGLVSSTLHRDLSREELGDLVLSVKLEDDFATRSPASFVQKLTTGQAIARWLSPEYRTALDSLQPEQVERAASVLFRDDRKRFHIEFGAGR
jgi:hypothetical protein